MIPQDYGKWTEKWTTEKITEGYKLKIEWSKGWELEDVEGHKNNVAFYFNKRGISRQDARWWKLCEQD